MSRRLRHQCVRSIGQLRRPSEQRSASGSFPLHRPLRFEPLEDRRLLSITVNTLVDEQDGSIVDGDVSLRDAIAIAASGETIGFSVSGTINLTGLGDLVINKNLTINGPGASLLTIRAFNPSAAVADGRRVFLIDDGNAPSVKNISISGLTLSGGDMNGAGGAIRNAAENLSITGCTISGNHATVGGAIHSNTGQLSISGSTISGNTSASSGAGIYAQGGSLSVTASTVSGNSTPTGGSGGGIFSGGSTATIDSSTISGNSANYGGGISHGGPGTLMTINNSTISGNSARRDGGGVGTFYSNVTIRHSTITANRADSDSNGTGNGGGVFVTSTLSNSTLHHTIVAGNFRQASTRSDVFGAVVTSSSFNLVGVNTGLTGISNGTIGNQIGTVASPIDPLLSVLDFNGGPMRTHALLAGSPAIDAGDPAFSPPPTNDQRGAPFLRVADGDGIAGARIDIGAYEQPSFVVDTLADELDFDFSAGHLSLREAIALANASTAPDTITFAEALTSGGAATILLTLGELAISRELSIIGPGSDLLTIDASGNDPTPSTNNGDGSRVFHIENASVVIDVSISGLTLTGGDCSEGGGAVFSTENLTVGACTIRDNDAASGGGVFSMNSSLTISDSTISGNHATFDGVSEGGGGGIVCLYDLVAISNSTISGNTATGNGGGIAGFVTLRHSTVTGNIADADNDGNGRGGGIHQILPPQYTGVVLDHTIVAKNTRVNGTRDDINGGIEAHYSLIGDKSGSSVFNDGTNLIGTVLAPIDPLFGPLADNGGRTMTQALLVGSPAIDAGNSSFNPADPDGNPLTNDAVPNDQRGAPFDRVFDGNSNGTARIDIGAYELQPKGILGDYNLNGTVDAADYVVWRKSLSGSVTPPFTSADGDGDGIVDADDHGVWRAHFGQTLPPPGAGSGAAATISSEADQFGEPVVQLPAKTTSEPAETEAATSRSASFAALETRSLSPDLSSRPRRSIHRYPVAASGGDDLPLLLAIDRVGRSPRQGSFVSDDSGNGECRADDDDSESEIHEPLAVALAE